MPETQHIKFQNTNNTIIRNVSEITIPFADLRAQYLSIKEEIDTAISAVIGSSAFIRGPYVDAFEREFASLLGLPHCISCGNGTDALYIAMRALNIKPGEEVITTAHSWVSTSETITQSGGNVVFCDTDQDTFTIDPSRIEEKITPRTVGIIPVHLYGQPADMDAIMEIANKYGLWVIEDCAQAHLAKYKGRFVGTFGDAATFSFYPGKNLGAMGDAGAIVTANAGLAKRSAMFARHGGLTKGDHQIEGINSRMDGLQAAILSVKLNYLESWTLARQRVASYYTGLLKNIDSVQTPVTLPDREHVWHLYVIRHENRDELVAHLSENNIQTAISYPVALPFLPAYSRYKHISDHFPNSFYNQSKIVSLPIYPEMPFSLVDRVINAIKSF